MDLPADHDALLRRIEADLLDGYDEELELEIEDRDLVEPPDPGSPGHCGIADFDDAAVPPPTTAGFPAPIRPATPAPRPPRCTAV